MRRLKSPALAQRFLSAYGPINNLFRCRRHLLSRVDVRAAREKAFFTWQIITNALAAA